MLRADFAICNTQVNMFLLGAAWRCLAALVVLSCAPLSTGQESPEAPARLTLHYRAEWRLLHAGDATLVLQRPPSPEHPLWRGDLYLRTVGLVDALHKVDNHYTVLFDRNYCAESSLLKAHEGKKRRHISVTFQHPEGKVSYLERDLVNDEIVDMKEINVPPCVHDELAALTRLRTMPLEVGEATELPVSNGKKMASARVEAQQRQHIKTPSGVYKTIRYEAFLYDNVLYRRKGRLFIWLTDDERRLPVQIRVKLRFYIGTITLQLEKEETT